MLVDLIYKKQSSANRNSCFYLDCGKTKMPIWSGLLWKNSVYLRARFLGELLKNIMGDKLV
jgi:hypothetical protein